MNLVFADAFYFVARLNRRDHHHARVIKFSRTFRARLLTTDWLLMEVADALAASACRPRVALVRHLRHAATCEIVPATRECLDQAINLTPSLGAGRNEAVSLKPSGERWEGEDNLFPSVVISGRIGNRACGGRKTS